MAWLRRRQRVDTGGSDKRLSREALTHLEEFAASRRGVEIYVEPPTFATEQTVVLIAGDGEWTRRRIDRPSDATKLSQRLGIPVYNVAATGYPSRMREWSAARKRAGKPDLPDPGSSATGFGVGGGV